MMNNINQAVLILIVANILVSMKGFKEYSFLERYKFQVGKILSGEKIRLLTSGFLHVDWMHLGFNMYALYLFGDIVARVLGIPSFLIIYFGSLLAGSLYSLQYHKMNLIIVLLVLLEQFLVFVYASILLYPAMELYLFFIPIPIPGYIFGVGYLLYSIYGMKKQLGNTGHSAHLGGSMGGFVLTIFLYPSIFSTNMMLVIALGIPIILVLFFGEKLRNL